jgi:hypothetical protein
MKNVRDAHPIIRFLLFFKHQTTLYKVEEGAFYPKVTYVTTKQCLGKTYLVAKGEYRHIRGAFGK